MSALLQFLRFGLAGAASTLVDLLLLKLLLAMEVQQFVAVAVAFLAGLVVNLLMHKFFTFRNSPRLSPAQVLRYLAVVGINLAITELVVWAATALAGAGPFTGKLLSIPPVLAVGFVLARRWVFVAPRAAA